MSDHLQPGFSWHSPPPAPHKIAATNNHGALWSIENLPPCFRGVYQGSFRQGLSFACDLRFTLTLYLHRIRSKIMNENIIICMACRYFNSIQSECFSELFHNSFSMVVSAPTGSGKTVLLELAILRLFSQNITESGEFRHRPGENMQQRKLDLLQLDVYAGSYYCLRNPSSPPSPAFPRLSRSYKGDLPRTSQSPRARESKRVDG